MDEALIKKFKEAASEQNAEVFAVEANSVPAAVEKIARESGLKTFTMSEGLPHSIKAAMEAAGLSEAEPPADIAVTGASWGVAETGSLMVEGPRRGFITAEVHVAVIDAPRIVAGIEDVPLAGIEPPFTLVTGPSRTADIERVLVLGAHGPRRLVVLIARP